MDAMVGNIHRIRRYTSEHSELQSAHHFLYDVRLNKGDAVVDVIVIGHSPGETKSDWTISPSATEETSLFDFHDVLGKGRASGRWWSAIKYFLGTDRVVLSNYFFWSAPKGEIFVERYGQFSRSSHLDFCRDLNFDLLRYHSPAAVVSPGISISHIIGDRYGLRHVDTRVARSGQRLVEHFEHDRMPWLFMKHWTGTKDFSADQRADARDYVRTVLARRIEAPTAPA